MPPKASPIPISLLLALALLACGGGASEDVASRPAPLVEAVEARYGALPLEETLPGVVRARNQVMIRPEIDGRVVEVLARSGQAVERGELLVRLDRNEPRERLRQAEADVRLEEAAAAAQRARVAELEARVSRNRALAREELVSEQELESLEAELVARRASADEAAARVEQARATVDERRLALDKTDVRAPVAGRLGERRAEVGMLVDPSSILFPVGDLAELIVEIDVPEAMLGRLDPGLPAIVEARGEGAQPIRAELSRISPFLAQRSFTTVGEIDLPNPDDRLRPGMFVNVRILVGETRRAVLVPTGSLWEDPRSGEIGVFMIAQPDGLTMPAAGTGEIDERERGAVFRRVEVLAEGGGVSGVAGVDEGAWVVTVGQHLLASELRTAAVAAETGAVSDDGIAARVRPVAWERVLGLQSLQDEDLLAGFLDKQRKVAAALGAEIPASEDEVDRVMQAARAQAAQGGGS